MMKPTALVVTLVLAGGATSQPAKAQPAKEQVRKEQARKKQGKGELKPRQQPRPENAADLFRGFRDMAGLEATFTEEKHLALLAIPLKSSGTLYFQRPGYLCRMVAKPQPSKVTITPTELRVEHGDGKKTKEVIDLRASAEVRQFVTSLVQVFRGDTKTLSKSYGMQFTPDKSNAKRWSLALKPKAAPLNKMIRSLSLRGEGREITAIELIEPKGDRTLTRIQKANPKRIFSAAEQKKLFGIEPKAKKGEKAKKPR